MNISKNGKISFIFGAIGFVELFIIIVCVEFLEKFILTNFFSLFVDIEPILIFSAWIFDVLSIYFGIKGLKSGEKRLARTGIILSALGLLEYLLLYFILASTFGMI